MARAHAKTVVTIVNTLFAHVKTVITIVNTLFALALLLARSLLLICSHTQPLIVERTSNLKYDNTIIYYKQTSNIAGILQTTVTSRPPSLLVVPSSA